MDGRCERRLLDRSAVREVAIIVSVTSSIHDASSSSSAVAFFSSPSAVSTDLSVAKMMFTLSSIFKTPVPHSHRWCYYNNSIVLQLSRSVRIEMVIIEWLGSAKWYRFKNKKKTSYNSMGGFGPLALLLCV